MNEPFSDAQIRAQMAFAEAAMKTHGRVGRRKREGRLLNEAALSVQKAMKGRDFSGGE